MTEQLGVTSVNTNEQALQESASLAIAELKIFEAQEYKISENEKKIVVGKLLNYIDEVEKNSFLVKGFADMMDDFVKKHWDGKFSEKSKTESPNENLIKWEKDHAGKEAGDYYYNFPLLFGRSLKDMWEEMYFHKCSMQDFLKLKLSDIEKSKLVIYGFLKEFEAIDTNNEKIKNLQKLLTEVFNRLVLICGFDPKQLA